MEDDIQTFSTTHPEAVADAATPQPAATTTTPPATTAAAPAAEEKPAPTSDPSSTPEDEDAPTPGESPQQTAARTRSRLQKRIDDITRARYTAEGQTKSEREENARLRAQLDALRAPQPSDTPAPAGAQAGDTPPPPASGADPRPKPDAFDTYEEYLDARDAWNRTQWTHEQERARADAKARDERVQADRAEQDVLAKNAERVQAFKTQHPDFDEKVATLDLEIHKAVLRELRTSEHGAAIVYELASNPEDAKRFASLSVQHQLKDIGRREGRFERATPPSAEPARPTPKPVTQAPAPLEPLGGPAASARNPEDLDVDDYVDEMNRRELTARRRK